MSLKKLRVPRYRRLLILSAVVFVAGVLVFVLLCWPFLRQPTFQGKKIGAWISELNTNAPVESLPAYVAILSLREKAVPYLVEATRLEPPEWQRTYGKVYRMLPLPVASMLPMVSANTDNIRANALLALGKLGPTAASAVPDATEALRSDSQWVAWCAAITLGAFGTNAVSALPALQNVALDQTIRDWGLRRMALGSLTQIDPQGTKVLPALIKALEDKETQVCVTAVISLQRLGRNAAPAVPNLISAMKRWQGETDGGNMIVSISNALGAIGPEAREAIPGLETHAQSQDPKVRRAAESALQRIRAR